MVITGLKYFKGHIKNYYLDQQFNVVAGLVLDSDISQILAVESEYTSLVPPDEEGGWEVLGHDVQPGQVEWARHVALAWHWEGQEDHF